MSDQTNGSSNGSRKVALITGITGQDGSYLAELLIEKGYVTFNNLFSSYAKQGIRPISYAETYQIKTNFIGMRFMALFADPLQETLQE